MTPEEIYAATQAALDKAAGAIGEAQALVVPPVAPPEPPRPRQVPDNVVAVGDPGGVRLTWIIPPALAGLSVFVAWGAGEFIGKATLPSGATTFRLPDLVAGTTYAIDIGLFDARGGQVTDLTRVTATPLPPTPAPEPPVVDPPELYPAAGTDADKVTWIRSGVGVGHAQLATVANAADLKARGLPGSWTGGVNGTWNLPRAVPGGYQNLDVRGLIYYTGPDPLTLDHVRAQGVRYSSSAGKQGGTFRYCTMVAQPGSPLGRGAIQMWGQSGWEVDHCDLSGAVDGMQVAGNGAIHDSWVHDLVYGPSPDQGGGPSHGDGIQAYSGMVQVDRVVMDLGNKTGSVGYTNGALFCSEASAWFVANDLFATVAESNANILHANRSPKGITVNSGRLQGGRIISPLNNVKLGPGVTRA